MEKKTSLIVKLLTKEIKAVKSLYKSFDFSHKQQKYQLSDYLTDILYVKKTGIAWRDLRTKMSWNSVYKVFIKINKFKIFEISYAHLLSKYLKKYPGKKLRFISTDSTFIPNKKGHDVIGYSTFYNRKNGTKISIITDAYGIPLNINCYKGNTNDCRVLRKQLRNPSVIKRHNYDKRKKYFLADPAYDSKEIRILVEGFGYVPIIARNKRNTRDIRKIVHLNDKDKKLYRKRLIVERTFNKMKFNKRICMRYDSKIESFMGFIYLSCIDLLC